MAVPAAPRLIDWVVKLSRKRRPACQGIAGGAVSTVALDDFCFVQHAAELEEKAVAALAKRVGTGLGAFLKPEDPVLAYRRPGTGRRVS